MATKAERYDLIVVGGGLGGLSCAALAQARGLRVALVEAHTRLGGCMGTFERGPYRFDVGATALMGLAADEPIGALCREVGLAFAGQPTPGYRVCLPDRTLTITPDQPAFEGALAAAFPGPQRARRAFWRLQDAVGATLFRVASRVPRLPARSLGDLTHDLRVLGARGLLAASTWLLTVDQVLRLLGLHHDREFRALVAMLLQDTAQAGPERVPFAIAAACLHAYRAGMSRPIGGMAALAEGLGDRFQALGGTLHRGTIADRVEREPGGLSTVVTRRGERLRADHLALNLPIDLAGRLLDQPLAGPIQRGEVKSRALWSAVTAYLAIDRAAVPDDSPLFHQILMSYDEGPHDGNNVLVSLSAVEDEGYGPPDVRVATLSTHTRPADWAGLSKDDRATRKADYTDRLTRALGRALPEAPTALRHVEVATPRAWQRYTRRLGGAVGGAPVGHGNSTFFAVGPDLFGRGVHLVGDSVFPGQGTMAVVLSAVRVVDGLTSQRGRARQVSGSLAPAGVGLAPT